MKRQSGFLWIRIGLISLVIGAAVMITMLRGVVSLLESYQVEVEQWVSQQVGVPIDYESLSADLIYLNPRLTVRGLRVGGPEQIDLESAHIGLQINLAQSILTRSLVLVELELEGLRASLVPKADGGWGVLGLPESGSAPAFNLRQFLERAEQISVQSSSILVEAKRPVSLMFEDEGQGLRLTSTDTQRVLSGEMQVVADLANKLSLRETVSIVATVERDGAALVDGQISAYLTLKPTPQRTPPIEQHALEAELWLSSDQGKGLIQGHGKWSLLLGNNTAGIELASKFAGEFSIHERSYALNFSDSSMYVDDHRLGLGPFGVTVGSSTSEGEMMVGAYLDVLEFTSDSTLPLLEVMKGLGVSEADRALFSKVGPTLRLEAVKALARLDQVAESLAVIADIKELSLSVADGIPGVSGFQGFMNYGLGALALDVDAQDLSLHFGNLYDKAWALETVRGRLALRQLEDGYALSSGKLLANSEHISAVGKLEMNLPRDRRDRTWGLMIGARNFDLSAAQPFIPSTVPRDAAAWLQDNLLSGRADVTGLIVHGSLDRVSPKIEKRYMLEVAVANAEVQYAPDWPNASEVSGVLQISNEGVYGAPLLANVLETTLEDLSLVIPFSESGELSEVAVAGRLAGDLSDAIELFQETPLKSLTNGIAEYWVGEGPISGEVSVTVPIGAPDQVVGVDVGVEVTNAQLNMNDLGLELNNLLGIFEFTSQQGLSARNVSIEMLGGESIANLSTRYLDRGGITSVDLKGSVNIAEVQSWLDLVLLRFAEGKTQYQGNLSIPFGSRSDLPSVDLETDLQGVTVDMPPPFAKVSADSKRRLALTQTFDPMGSEISFNWERSAGGLLKLEGDRVKGGSIEIGNYQPSAAAFDALRVRGRLPFASLEEWDSFLLRLDEFSSLGVAETFRERLDSIQVRADEFDLFGYPLKDVVLGLYPAQDRWHMTLDNEQVIGSVQLSDDEDAPLEVLLKKLNLNSDGTQSDPLLGLTSADLMPADVTIESIVLDGDDYGSWAFELRPAQDLVALNALKAEVKGMQINAADGLKWYPGADRPRSEFEGEVIVQDMQACLAAWGFASGLEGENFKYQSTLTWPGSPLNIDIARLRGSIGVEGGKGRIVQAETSSGALKLLGIFDFAEIAKRFSFDLNSLLSEGHAFNQVTGRLDIGSGSVLISEPLRVLGAGSQLTVAGQVNLVTEVLDNDLILTLPLNKNLPWYAAYSAIATGPLAGAGVMLAREVFKDQINELTSLKYEVTGTLSEPEVMFVSIFDDSVRDNAEVTAESAQSAETSL